MGIFESHAGYHSCIDERGMISIRDIDLNGKRVMVRADLNVAVSEGRVVSDQRIRAALETIEFALRNNAAVLVVSHFGRPQEGVFEDRFSLAPIAKYLSDCLKREIRFVSEWIDGVDMSPGDVALCENVRFLEGEYSCDDKLARRMASLCDVLVMDAFGAAHRNQSSTAGVVRHAPVACAGLLFQKEIDSLDKALQNPERPVAAIVGGSKLVDKLPVLKKLVRLADAMIVGGGIANTLLVARGHSVGRSLYAPEMLDLASKLLRSAKKRHCSIPLPVDVVVAKSPEDSEFAAKKKLSSIEDDDMIFDIGEETAENYCKLIRSAKTIIWNGPVGMFEKAPFSSGTKAIARAVSNSSAHSIAGGGDTLAALQQWGMLDGVSYTSTGGGAFLEYIQGEVLPAVQALQQYSRLKPAAS